MDDIVRRVIRGDYGEEGKRRLQIEGYDYELIQNEVNKRLECSKRRDPFDY